MKTRGMLALGLGVLMAVATAVLISASILSESEPNDTVGTADPLLGGIVSSGSISPSGDVDYYALSGLNTTWGFIALLDTISSTTSTSGTLTALGSDGTTMLQSDTGSWERGSGIALQNYADGGATHYLRVNEHGDDATISPYTLRYYRTIVAPQPEAEPNETRASGTPSAFTHSGTISPAGDVDCFAFHGRAGDVILLALDGDPEGDGSPVDPVLELLAPSGSVLKTADVSGGAGREFIEYEGLASEGVYAYCVRDKSGGGSAAATYKVGLVRNGGLYFPAYVGSATWLDPRAGDYALLGDLLSFRLAVTNTSPITIPGAIQFTATYSDTCLGLVGVVPSATISSPGFISWEGQKSGLAPGEVYSVTLTALAQARCDDRVRQNLALDYYLTGHSHSADYSIYGSVYLPLVLRGTP